MPFLADALPLWLPAGPSQRRTCEPNAYILETIKQSCRNGAELGLDSTIFPDFQILGLRDFGSNFARYDGTVGDWVSTMRARSVGQLREVTSRTLEPPPPPPETRYAFKNIDRSLGSTLFSKGGKMAQAVI